MTKEEAKEVILQNQDKSLNEIKRIIKKKMDIRQRTAFTSEHLFELILEINREKQNSKQIFSNIQKNNKTIKKEGEER